MLERSHLTDSKKRVLAGAAAELLELATTAQTEPPEDYHEWEKEYARLKWAGHSCNECTSRKSQPPLNNKRLFLTLLLPVQTVQEERVLVKGHTPNRIT